MDGRRYSSMETDRSDATLRRHQRHRNGEIVDLEPGRSLDGRPSEIAVDGAAQYARDLGNADERLARDHEDRKSSAP